MGKAPPLGEWDPIGMGTKMSFARSASSAARAVVFALCASATVACGALRDSSGPDSTGGGAGMGGAPGDGTGAIIGGAARSRPFPGGATGLDTTSSPCITRPPPPQSLIRLAFPQLARSITSVLGNDALDGFSVPEGIALQDRVLFERNGSNEFYEGSLEQTIEMAEAAVAHQFSPDRFAAATGCDGDDACVRAFLLDVADRAFRRPLVDDEKASILQSYSDMRSWGLAPNEAGASTVEGILVSPAVVYRTEFGRPDDGAKETTLTPLEKAVQLSYFLSDGPPDTTLRRAAESGALDTRDELGGQVERYLQMPAVRANMVTVMVKYYQFKHDLFPSRDPAIFPEWGPAVLASMIGEAQAFMEHTVWEGTVFDQLTSHRSYIDENLASLYGVPYPGAPGSGFLPVDFPPRQRSGVLTMAPWLVGHVVVEPAAPFVRGYTVNQLVTCGPMPRLSHDAAGTLQQPSGSALDRAIYRLATQPCAGCHQYMDPFGVLLESYDDVGRFRTSYADTGEPIVPEVTLPAWFGGAVVHDVSELSEILTSRGVFSACLTAALLEYATSMITQLPTDDCLVRNPHTSFWAGDKSFASLVREVALSDAFSQRTVSDP